MIPLICTFERKKPQARKLVVIAALVTIAVISRTVFYMIPFFKPMLAVVIISGIGLGWECGFIVGTASAFMSNFIFGQGPGLLGRCLQWELSGLYQVSFSVKNIMQIK